MTDNALVITEQPHALSAYQTRDDVRELGDRLIALHPAAGDVGPAGMRAAAQLALLLGANPLPGVNEVHIWKDSKGRTCMSLGINYWRRMSQEWGGVLYQVQPRAMRPEEAKEYGIASGITAAICRGVRTDDMIRFKQLGFTTNEIWDMCGATGVGTVGANEYAKQGRPLLWTATKRAETDLLRQLFPAQFGHVAGQVAQAPVTVLEGDAVEPEDAPAGRYTLSDANRDLFGVEPTRKVEPTLAESVEWQEEPPARATGNGQQQPPAQAAADDPGPLADDELTINEARAVDFFPVAAGLLSTDEATIKGRMKALGYGKVPGHSYERVAAYRRLRDEERARDGELAEIAAERSSQDDLFGSDDTAARAAALATAQGQLD